MIMSEQRTIEKQRYCRHYFCRCARANELAMMGRIYEGAHVDEVRCRMTVEEARIYEARPEYIAAQKQRLA